MNKTATLLSLEPIKITADCEKQETGKGFYDPFCSLPIWMPENKCSFI